METDKELGVRKSEEQPMAIGRLSLPRRQLFRAESHINFAISRDQSSHCASSNATYNHNHNSSGNGNGNSNHTHGLNSGARRKLYRQSLSIDNAALSLSCDSPSPCSQNKPLLDHDHSQKVDLEESSAKISGEQIVTEAQRPSYGSMSFSCNSRSRTHSHSAFDSRTFDSFRPPRCSAPMYWKVCLWIGVVLLLAGFLLVLTGFAFPRRPLIVGNLSMKQILAINQQAVDFNERLEVCKLSGLTLFCIGCIFAMIGKFAPKVFLPPASGGKSSFSEGRPPAGCWYNIDTDFRLEMESEAEAEAEARLPHTAQSQLLSCSLPPGPNLIPLESVLVEKD